MGPFLPHAKGMFQTETVNKGGVEDGGKWNDSDRRAKNFLR